MNLGFTTIKAYRYAAILMAALFLILQGVSMSHAASYGSDPHEHDGVLCEVSLHNEANVIVPTPAAVPELPALQSSLIFVFETNFTDAPTGLYRGREPPPRAPPS